MTMLPPTDAPKPGLRAKIIEEYATLARVHGLKGPVLEVMHGPRQNAISLAPFLSEFERHVLVRGDDGERGGVQFHQGTASDMGELFEDGCFSTVIWDRALEHDPRFWLSAAEIRRVLSPGGLLIVCTRGFAKSNKFGVKVVGAQGKALPFLTGTSAIDAVSADFWRLSPQAMRKVVLDGFDVKETRMAFMMPHLFGVGVKPG